jgi:hypothetical protein
MIETDTKLIETCWRIIGQLTNYEGISITVPHDQYPGGEGYQLRCWQGRHGYTRRGHIDKGTAEGKLLFETRIAERLNACDCCFPTALDHIGINHPDGMEWEREIKQSKDGSSYDLLTLRVPLREATIEQVILQPKAAYQKDDCLFCNNPSTQQAYIAANGRTTGIRCCENPNCVESAKQQALDYVNSQ